MRSQKLIKLGVLVLSIGILIWVGLRIKIYIDTYIPSPDLQNDVSDEINKENLDAWFQDLHKSGKFNGAVLVAKESKPVLIKTYGYTNSSLSEHLTPRSSFRLASVSKQFTAFGIMVLAENGKLKFDDLVSDYIVDFPYEGVTIRHLANMTSGIPDIYQYLAYTYKSEIDPVLSTQEAVDLVIRYPNFGSSPNGVPNEYAKPNTEYAYNNTNYAILARIIELVSEKSFEAFMQTEIFTPLKMHNTRVWNLLSQDKDFLNKTGEFELTVV